MKPVEREGLIADFSDLLRQLDYDKAHPLTCLLIDQVALRWLQLSARDHAYAQEVKLTPRERADWEKRIAAAHRRLNAASESLAHVDRILHAKLGVR